jgi:hypothetical protein
MPEMATGTAGVEMAGASTCSDRGGIPGWVLAKALTSSGDVGLGGVVLNKTLDLMI